jgi:uncharacterized protein involved in type VI secretion and phage assembly
VSDNAPTYAVSVAGAPLDQEVLNQLKEIRVSSYLHLPDVCVLQVAFPKAEGIDSMPFHIGDPLEVKLGSSEDETDVPQTLFKGEIVTLEPEFGAGGCAVSIRAYDRAHRLHRSRNTMAFQDMTSSDIVQKIVGAAGFSAKCDSSGDTHAFMQQDNETDWDFIWRLADRIGFEFIVEDRNAYFRKPTPEGDVELTWPDTLRSFRPRVTAVQQVSSVDLAAFDPKTKQAITGQATSPNQVAEIGFKRQDVMSALPESKIHIATEPVKMQGEANGIAQALLDKLANGYIAAEGVAPGNPKIKAGAKVKVGGIGSKFSGTYRIAYAAHVLKGAGYETHFANSASNTVLSAVGGSNGGGSSPNFAGQLVLAVVTNNQDPDGMGRVRVKYPALSDSVEGWWARIATPSAGNTRGLMMMPQVGEEVLVGFEHDDTTRPYVIGSLFNGKDKPGDDLADKDGKFTVLSDSQALVQTKGDITLKTAGGGKGSGGTDGDLVIDIASNIKEKCKKDWTHDITGSATLKASSNFNIEGMSVSVKANGSMTIEGQGGVTIKCGGSQVQISPSGVTISGPLINIG